MSTAEASFGIKVVDESASGVASATGNLQNLKAKLQEDTGALSQMQAALKNLNKSTIVNVEQFKKLKEAIAAKKTEISAGQSKVLEYANAFEKSAKDARSFGEQIKAALAGVGGPIGNTASKLTSLSDKLGKAGVAGGAILATAAFVALGIAATAAVVAISKFGLSAADAYRDEKIMLEGMTKVPMWLGLWGTASKTSGAQIQANIDGIIGSVSQSRGEIVGLAQELYTMGIRGKASLKAVADAQAVGGARGKAYAIGLMSWNRMLGKSAEQTAAQLEKQFGGLAAAKAMGFGKQIEKLHENIKLLFSEVKIQGFLLGLKKVTDLFSQTSVTGKALKQIIEVLFNPIFGGAGKAGDLIKDLFRDAVIWVQKAVIAFQELQIKMLETFDVQWWDEQSGKLAHAALWGIIGLLGSIGVLLIGIAVKVAIIAAPFLLLGAAIVAAGAAAYLLFDQIRKAFAEISFDDIWDLVIAPIWDKWGAAADAVIGMGGRIVDGIVAGITGGAGKLWSSITNLAKGTVKLLKNLLGIHSPSLVFKAQAKFIPLGMAAGISQGMPAVHGAMRQMVQVPEMPMYTSPSVSNDNGRRSSSVTNQITIQIDGAKEPRAIADEVIAIINQQMEGATIIMGAA